MALNLEKQLTFVSLDCPPFPPYACFWLSNLGHSMGPIMTTP